VLLQSMYGVLMSNPYGPWTKTQDERSLITFITSSNSAGTTSKIDTLVGKTTTRTGTRTPFYDNKPKAASRITSSVSHQPFSGRFVFTASPTSWTSVPGQPCFPSLAFTNAPSPSLSDSKCLLKLVRKTDPGWASLVDVGEFKETRSLVLSSLGLMHDVLHVNAGRLAKRVDRVRPRDFVELGKVVSESLLLYRLGLMPLISSVNDAIKAVQDQINGAVYDGKMSAKFVIGGDTKGDFPVSYASFTGVRQEVLTWKNVVKFGGTVRPDKANHQIDFRDSFGLRGRHIVPTIYNLIPYSFLVDYISNVGNALELMAYQNGFLRDGWSVHIQEASIVTSFVASSSPVGTRIVSQFPGKSFYDNFSYTRGPVDLDALISASSRKLELRIPDLLQLATAGALVGARLRGHEVPAPRWAKNPPKGFLKSLKQALV